MNRTIKIVLAIILLVNQGTAVTAWQLNFLAKQAKVTVGFSRTDSSDQTKKKERKKQIAIIAAVVAAVVLLPTTIVAAILLWKRHHKENNGMSESGWNDILQRLKTEELARKKESELSKKNDKKTGDSIKKDTPENAENEQPRNDDTAKEKQENNQPEEKKEIKPLTPKEQLDGVAQEKIEQDKGLAPEEKKQQDDLLEKMVGPGLTDKEKEALSDYKKPGQFDDAGKKDIQELIQVAESDSMMKFIVAHANNDRNIKSGRQSLLGHAVYFNNEKFITFLIGKGHDPLKKEGNSGLSPLAQAVYENNAIDLIPLLTEKLTDTQKKESKKEKIKILEEGAISLVEKELHEIISPEMKAILGW